MLSLHPWIDIFFMQSLIVNQISNLDPLVWHLGQGCAVALGLIEKCDLQNLRHVTFGSFHAKRPGPSSLTLFKFVQNVLKCCLTWLTFILKILAQYLLYF